VPDLPIAVVGASGQSLDNDAARAVDAADVVVGGRANLDAFAPCARRRIVVNGDVGTALDELSAAEGRVCVIASGDPGFFGIVRALAARFGSEALDVRPAPSSVALAFARLGIPWDDAVVVSAHGRPLADAARAAAAATKAAVLTSPDSSPRRLGAELVALGARHQRVAVCSDLGSPGEHVHLVDLESLAGRDWPDRSVVVLLDGPGVSDRPTLAWGLDEGAYSHRNGMVTKAEVRAVALGKLALPRAGVIWDVGAGSASVAVECARLCPALRVVAVERDAGAVERARANVADHLVAVEVVEGEAPDALAGLPDPDRAFVGGGGVAVLEAVLARLRPGGRVVATFAALDRAARAFDRLGQMSQVAVSRAEALPGGGVRLVAHNPVFVAWGPSPAPEPGDFPS